MMRRAVERTVRSICRVIGCCPRPVQHAATESVDDDVWTNAFEFGRSVEQHRAGIDEAGDVLLVGHDCVQLARGSDLVNAGKGTIMPSASSARSCAVVGCMEARR